MPHRQAAVPGGQPRTPDRRACQCTRAEAIGMDYNIVEAIDQPWKFFEGGVGPYWGILNADREPKFAWTGPIVNENYWKLALGSRRFGDRGASCRGPWTAP